ncbi:hypothetical protein [Pyrodictium abyssi]|uniref:Uncharacterized protein n=1 Tax=Pyrodictium abyssi TaxID=54256 RepID=A0ABM8IXX2_9CREN|nr:hypothetical protein PABY_19310 [Pyrodictium abyssi]
MNTRIASIITLALLLAPIIAPLTATKAAAETIAVEVSATKLNYNIILLKIKNLPSDKYPAVLVTPYDASGNPLTNEPYTLIAGYVGGNEWHVFIALNETFKYGVFGFDYANTSSTKINATDGTNYYDYDMNKVGKVAFYITSNLTDSLSRTSPILAIDGKKVINITNIYEVGGGSNNFFDTSNITKAWPLVNALYVSGADSIKVTVDAGDLGSQTVTIDLGPSAAELQTTGYLDIAPEKSVEFKMSDPTLLADPTATDSLTYTNSSVGVTISTAGTKVTPIFNMTADGSAAMKAAAMEAGAGDLANGLNDINITVQLINVTTWAALYVNATKVPENATIFVKLGISAINGTAGTWYNRTVYVVLTNSTNEFKVFNWTSTLTGSSWINVTINSVKVTFIPAKVAANINGFENAVKYKTELGAINVTYTPEQYAFIDSVSEDSGVLVAKLYMPGRDEVPSYDFLVQDNVAVSGAPVVLRMTEGAGAGEGSVEVDAFIRLQTGTITVPSTVKPGDSFTISVEDIDAAAVTVNVTLYDKNDNKLASELVTLDSGSTAGQFSKTLKILLPKTSSAASIDTTNGIIYVNGSVAKIVSTYTDKYAVDSTQVERSAATSVKFHPVSVSLPNTAGKDAVVTMTLSSGNLNLDAAAKEFLYIEIPSGQNYAEIRYGGTNGLTVAKVYIKKNDALITSTDLEKVFIVRSFYESDVNTGTYNIQLYLNQLGLANGNKIEVDVYDTLNDQWYNNTIEITAVQGTVKVYAEDANGNKIPVDSIPIAAANGADVSVVYKVEVDDSDANTYASKPDTVTLFFYFLRQGESSATPQKVTIAETDINTGVFEGTLNITYFSDGTVNITIEGKNITLTRSDMPYGKLVIMYNDTSVNKNVTIELQVKSPESATLAIEPTIVDKLTDNVTIVLYEPDLDTIPGAGNDALPSGLTFSLSAEGSTKTSLTVKEITDAGYKFKEVESGKFKLEIPAKALLELIYGSGKASEGIGKLITIGYTDPVAKGSVRGSIVTVSSSDSFKVSSHTAEVTVTPEKVSPYGKIKIVVYDPDLAGVAAGYVLNKTSIADSRLLASSSKAAQDTLTKAIAYVYPGSATGTSDNGTFVFELQLSDTLVNPVDSVVIVYKDLVDANGQEKVISKIVNVYTETGSIEVPEQAQPNSVVEIKVKDFDANKDSNSVDTIWVIVYSDALNIRKNITLVETGPDTGVFSNLIRLSDNPADIGKTNTIYAPAGSTVYVEYVDKLGANGEENVEVKGSFKVTGAAVAGRPLMPDTTKVAVKDPMTGETISKVKPGKQAMIVIPVENTAAEDVQVYVIVQVYKDGVPVAFNAGVSVVKAGSVVNVPAMTPVLTEPGTYTVKVLLWKDLTTMEPLAEKTVELSIEVGQ